MEIFLEKVTGAAIPSSDEDLEVFNSFKIGQKFEVLPWDDRNAQFHRKFFSMLGIVSERNPKWKNRHSLCKACQFGIGHVNMVANIHGQLVPVPKSISFKNMKEPEFIWLYKEVSQYLLTNLELLIPGMSPNEFKMQVQRVLDYI